MVYLCPLTAQLSTTCECGIQKPKVERELAVVTLRLANALTECFRCSLVSTVPLLSVL